MKLYYMPGACSLATHITMRELGMPVDLVAVGRDKKCSNGEDFMAVNPKGYVPALTLDDGQVLTEGTAIMPYLADQKPAVGLAPACGTLERARLQEWLGFINSEVHKQFAAFFTPNASDQMKQSAGETIGRRFDQMQKLLGEKPFLLGNQFSVADAYAFTVLGWCGHVGIDLGKWPALKAYHGRVAARPKVLEALKAEGLIK